MILVGGDCMHDFFYRMNSRMVYLLSVPSRYRYFITILIAFFLGALWFFCLYRPLCASLKKYRHLHSVPMNRDALTHEKNVEYVALKKIVDAAESAYAKEINTVQSPRILDVVNEIFNALARYNLTFCSYAPEGVFDEGLFIKHVLLFEIKGSFTALQQFFMAIEKSAYLLINDMIRLHKNMSDELSCTCKLTFLQLKKECDEK